MKTFAIFSDFINHSLSRRVHAINERDQLTNQDFYLFICRYGYQTMIVEDPGNEVAHWLVLITCVNEVLLW